MLGLLIFIGILIVGAVVGTLTVRLLWDFWFTPPLPPPPEPLPPPKIMSAEGTSAKTVHLTLSQIGIGQVELERFRPDLGTSFGFFASINSTELTHVDDTYGLHPDKSYIYRVRRTHPPNSAWSHPPQQGIEAHTLGVAFDPGQLFDPTENWQGNCLVQRFEPNVLSRSGSLVSITIRASLTGLSIVRIWISHADEAVGMDAYDSAEERKPIYETIFNHPPLVIGSTEAHAPKTLPAIPFTLDHTKALLIAVEFNTIPNSGIMFKEVSPRVAAAYYKVQGPLQPQEQPEAMKRDRSGFLRYPV